MFKRNWLKTNVALNLWVTRVAREVGELRNIILVFPFRVKVAMIPSISRMYLFGDQFEPCANGPGSFHTICKCQDTSGVEIRNLTSAENFAKATFFATTHAPRSYEVNRSAKGSHRIGYENI